MTEDLLYKTPDTFRLIKVLFAMLAGMMLIALILVFVLDVNEVSASSGGELIASDKPKEYIATSDYQIEQINVKEGDFVKVGDTIAVFSSNELIGSIYKQRSEIQIEEKRLEGIEQNIGILEKQITQTNLDKSRLASSLTTEKYSKEISLSSLETQLNAARQNLDLLKVRLDKDLELLQKGAISQIDYQKKEQQYLGDKAELARLEGRYDQQSNELNNIQSSQSRDLGKQDLAVLRLEGELMEAMKKKQELELSLFQKRQHDVALRTELENLVIKADMEGHISQLFNRVNNVNILKKGTVIAKVSPSGSSEFYGKLMVAEESLKDVKPGQQVNIKLDAYNHYQYGVIKGKVIHVDREQGKEGSNFYVLASIEEYNPEVFRLKDGYKISGEIIIRRIGLNTYISNKVFKKMKM